VDKRKAQECLGSPATLPSCSSRVIHLYSQHWTAIQVASRAVFACRLIHL